MTMVVGYAPDGRGRAVLHLAALLARSEDDDLVLCGVVPARWPPSPARVDAEYQAFMANAAREALEQARARLPEDIPATLLVRHARSAAAGLLDVATEHEASTIVAGSALAGGSGMVEIGSTTSQLVHSSPIPVALAPRGFRTKPGERVQRVTAAFSEGADNLLIAAAAVAGQVGASLRVASFAVRAHPPLTAGIGSSPERAVIRQWERDVRAAAVAALEPVEELPAPPAAVECVIGYGASWEDALEDIEWDDGDLLLVGSSSIGQIARVFLGSRAWKIVRNSPVPVVVVPRGAAAELAEEAVQGIA